MNQRQARPEASSALIFASISIVRLSVVANGTEQQRRRLPTSVCNQHEVHGGVRDGLDRATHAAGTSGSCWSGRKTWCRRAGVHVCLKMHKREPLCRVAEYKGGRMGSKSIADSEDLDGMPSPSAVGDIWSGYERPVEEGGQLVGEHWQPPAKKRKTTPSQMSRAASTRGLRRTQDAIPAL
ncbi:hypothetical protein EVG20_g5430 [Dentipellis fragilis]|uniref:Uncharacterized protein n=1 Tax=Dentipellis fragilis TaxID=205917 RepID=A0A4Y9YX02_9AGAM|nr:hypothetical protein EVG20_g5430 [Dentipellis fragilis]